MKLIRRMVSRLSTVRDLFSFLWQQRLWWLTPMMVVLVLLGLLLVFAQGSAVAPFIYTLF